MNFRNPAPAPSPIPSTTFGASFEHPYGFSMLDELHNFFPELLYDEAIFSNRMMAWARHRVQTLFGESYNRQQNMYRMYQQQARQATYREWARLHEVTTATATAATAAAAAAAPSPVTAAPSEDNTTAPSTPQRRIAPAGVTPPPLINQNIQNRLRFANTSLENVLMNPTNFLQLLAGTMGAGDIDIEFHDLRPAVSAWQDVYVAPTQTQLERGSVLISHSGVSTDTNCAICQEHELAGGSGTNEPATWRQLHCNHFFHQACIDTWFQQNVHCPVCRADIRDVGTATPTSASSTV